MPQSSPLTFTRRSVLTTAGALSLLSSLGGCAALAAGPEQNENDLNDFLNEEAAYKPSPVWADEIVDMTGQDTAEVAVGAMTSIEMPNFPFDEAPVAFAPMAIEISPGTEVTWTWPTLPEDFPPIPHDVVSLEDGLFNSDIRAPGGDDFVYAFEEPGTYFYYCTPHGAPFEVENHEGETVYNEFGMRGAVIVTDE